jgi:hypothetical protein
MQGIQGLFDEDYIHYHDAPTGAELTGDEASAAEKVFNLAGKDATFKDSVTGQPFEPMLVKAARKLVVEHFETKGCWARRRRAEAESRRR